MFSRYPLTFANLHITSKFQRLEYVLVMGQSPPCNESQGGNVRPETFASLMTKLQHYLHTNTLKLHKSSDLSDATSKKDRSKQETQKANEK